MKIAIVGTAPGEMDAPFDDASFELWCVHKNTHRYPRVTRDFEIHEWNEIANHEVPTVTQANFPHQWVRENMPRYLRDDLYKSTFDYMMAYALWTHHTVDKIDLVRVCGVHMSHDDKEFFHQQPSFSGWVGYALNHFDVVVDDHSPLMKAAYVYGVKRSPDDHELYNAYGFDEAAQKHKNKIQRNKQIIAQLERENIAHSGAVNVYESLEQTERARKHGQRIKSIADSFQIPD